MSTEGRCKKCLRGRDVRRAALAADARFRNAAASKGLTVGGKKVGWRVGRLGMVLVVSGVLSICDDSLVIVVMELWTWR